MVKQQTAVGYGSLKERKSVGAHYTAALVYVSGHYYLSHIPCYILHIPYCVLRVACSPLKPEK